MNFMPRLEAEAVIWEMPGYLVWKDTNSIFLGCNKNLAKLTGFHSIDNFIGKTDFDIPCDAVKHAERYVQQDRKTINGLQHTILDIHKYADGKVYSCLTNRTTLKNPEGKIVGVICHMVEVNNNFLSKIIQLFSSSRISCVNLQGSYELANHYPNYNLSKREEECLFYILRGKPAKEIASILKISRKTVEGYIAQIKFKQGCCSKSALIEKSISMGLMNIIPKSIISKMPTS